MGEKTLSYRLIDVFADSPLQGNQLAVFLGAEDLKPEEMQKIAREMNLSETTFVITHQGDADSSKGIRTRIFTVKEELPFAGHPTLGTAFALRSMLKKDKITLSLKVGQVPVTFSDSSGEVFGEMIQPEPVFGMRHDKGEIARLFRVEEGELDPGLPVESVSTGNDFIIVPFRKLETLENIDPDFRAMEEYAGKTGAHFFYMVTRDTAGSGAILRARMMFYGGEDPATGSAAGPAAAWLLKHGVIRPGKQEFIEQGIEIKRPSRIYVRGSIKNGNPAEIRVGGKCFIVGSGELVISQ